MIGIDAYERIHIDDVWLGAVHGQRWSFSATFEVLSSSSGHAKGNKTTPDTSSQNPTTLLATIFFNQEVHLRSCQE
jgi:hypothetical protein